MSDKADSQSSYKSLVPHFQELKMRLSRSLLFVMLVFIILFPFSNDIYNQLADPLMRNLPTNSSMIAIDVASPFFIPFKLVMILSIFISKLKRPL